MAFKSNGVTVTASAWYLTGNGTLMSATLGQYANGLGVCYTGEACSGSNQQIDNTGNDEFLLFQFSKPVAPTSITLNSPTNGQLGFSYWVGNTANQSMNLANMDPINSLSTLGFGSQKTGNAGTGVGTINFGGAPTTPVNAILFGAQYGINGDNFDVFSLSGTPVLGSVPEPTSIILLFTVVVAVGLGVRRRAQQLHQ